MGFGIVVSQYVVVKAPFSDEPLATNVTHKVALSRVYLEVCFKGVFGSKPEQNNEKKTSNCFPYV